MPPHGRAPQRTAATARRDRGLRISAGSFRSSTAKDSRFFLQLPPNQGVEPSKETVEAYRASLYDPGDPFKSPRGILGEMLTEHGAAAAYHGRNAHGGVRVHQGAASPKVVDTAHIGPITALAHEPKLKTPDNMPLTERRRIISPRPERRHVVQTARNPLRRPIVRRTSSSSVVPVSQQPSEGIAGWGRHTPDGNGGLLQAPPNATAKTAGGGPRKGKAVATTTPRAHRLVPTTEKFKNLFVSEDAATGKLKATTLSAGPQQRPASRPCGGRNIVIPVAQRLGPGGYDVSDKDIIGSLSIGFNRKTLRRFDDEVDDGSHIQVLPGENMEAAVGRARSSFMGETRSPRSSGAQSPSSGVVTVSQEAHSDRSGSPPTRSGSRLASREEAARPDTARRSIGDYRMVRTIGLGNFGKVKLAVHTPTGHHVAIKILNRVAAAKRGETVRIDRELAMIRKASHPNIVKALEIIEDFSKSTVYLVMEYCENGELFDHIVHRRGSGLPEGEACVLFRDIVGALSHVHSLKSAHRDVKPENMLLDRWNRLKLADFSLSNTLPDGVGRLTTPCGSPCYASPEMIAGEPYDGTKSDVWSLGVSLYAMVTGHLPFENPVLNTLYDLVLVGKYDPLPASTSPELRNLVDGMLVVDPEVRLSLDAVMSHPWLYLWPAPEGTPDFSSAGLTPVVDEDVLSEVERLYHMKREDVSSDVIHNVCGRRLAHYYLTLYGMQVAGRVHTPKGSTRKLTSLNRMESRASSVGSSLMVAAELPTLHDPSSLTNLEEVRSQWSGVGGRRSRIHDGAPQSLLSAETGPAPHIGPKPDEPIHGQATTENLEKYLHKKFHKDGGRRYKHHGQNDQDTVSDALGKQAARRLHDPVVDMTIDVKDKANDLVVTLKDDHVTARKARPEMDFQRDARRKFGGTSMGVMVHKDSGPGLTLNHHTRRHKQVALRRHLARRLAAHVAEMTEEASQPEIDISQLPSLPGQARPERTSNDHNDDGKTRYLDIFGDAKMPFDSIFQPEDNIANVLAEAAMSKLADVKPESMFSHFSGVPGSGLNTPSVSRPGSPSQSGELMLGWSGSRRSSLAGPIEARAPTTVGPETRIGGLLD